MVAGRLTNIEPRRGGRAPDTRFCRVPGRQESASLWLRSHPIPNSRLTREFRKIDTVALVGPNVLHQETYLPLSLETIHHAFDWSMAALDRLPNQPVFILVLAHGRRKSLGDLCWHECGCRTRIAL